jgi:hypothetical protein
MWSHHETNNHILAITATSDVKASPEQRLVSCMQLMAFGMLSFQDIEIPPIHDLLQLHKVPRRQELAGMMCEAAAVVVEGFRSDIGCVVDNAAVIVGRFGHGCMAAWLHGCMAAWLHGPGPSGLKQLGVICLLLMVKRRERCSSALSSDTSQPGPRLHARVMMSSGPIRSRSRWRWRWRR